MKDPRLGSFGVISIVLLLLLKFFALQELAVRWLPLALVVGHSISRLVAVSYLATHSYVQAAEQSKVKPLAEQISVGGITIAVATAIIPLIISSSSAFWLALLPLILVRWVLGRLFVQKLGGYTGDCLGAAQQVSEVVYYLGLGILLGY